MLPVPQLVRRSVLLVPLLDREAVAQSWTHNADAVVLDLASVPFSDRRAARSRRMKCTTPTTTLASAMHSRSTEATALRFMGVGRGSVARDPGPGRAGFAPPCFPVVRGAGAPDWSRTRSSDSGRDRAG